MRPAKNSSNSCYEMQVATPYAQFDLASGCTFDLCRRWSDVVVVRPGDIKGEQRGRMASTLAQRLNDQGVTAGPHQPVARVGFLVGGQAGLVDRRREFG